MARSMMTITTRVAGTDNLITLPSLSVSRAVGRETKRLMKTGMSKKQAKQQASKGY